MGTAVFNIYSLRIDKGIYLSKRVDILLEISSCCMPYHFYFLVVITLPT